MKFLYPRKFLLVKGPGNLFVVNLFQNIPIFETKL